MNRLNRAWARFVCVHPNEVDTQVAGTRARVRYCPGCSRVRWVD